MKNSKKKSVIERPQVLRSIKYAKCSLDVIRSSVKAAKAAHRKMQVSPVYANALLSHVVDVLERAGVEDITSLPAWERVVCKHG